MNALARRILAVLRQQPVVGFATVSEAGRPWLRWVTVVAGPDLSLRFATSLKSRKVAHLRHNPAVHILSGPGQWTADAPFVQAAGRAAIITDAQAKQDFWRPALGRYWSDAGDPDYCVIQVTPSHVEFYSFGNQQPEVLDLP